MNRLNMDKKVAVISALCEGCSVRSTSRLTGVSKGAILRLLEEVGTACAEYQDKAIHNVWADRVQVDEIWSFVGAKQKNVTPALIAKGVAGDVWTFVAIEADTKLVISWSVGMRDAEFAADLLRDVRNRVANPIQLTTDGHKMYLKAVPEAFEGMAIDYAQLIKVFGNDPEAEKRYSPAQCRGIEKKVITGSPDPKFISTSYVERQNLTMRMNMRRFTRLTNAFSKKLENHAHAVELFYMHYNFVRIHQTLRVTPAMAAGVSSRLWSIHDIVAMAEASTVSEAA
jgi:IS1 family transposase